MIKDRIIFGKEVKFAAMLCLYSLEMILPKMILPQLFKIRARPAETKLAPGSFCKACDIMTCLMLGIDLYSRNALGFSNHRKSKINNPQIRV